MAGPKNKLFSVEESVKELQADTEKIMAEIETRAKSQLQNLQLQVHAMLVEIAQKELKSTRDLYIQNLVTTQSGDSIYVVGLKEPGQWVEDGYGANTLFERVLDGGKPAKVSKDGDRYKVIPFKINKRPSESSLADQQIAKYAQNELKKRGLNKPVVMNGKPVVGKIATFSPTGKDQPISKFNRPLLQGATVYQKVSPKGKVTRDVFTFRVISDKQKGSGLWENKEWKGLHAFDKIQNKIEEIWTKMVKELVNIETKDVIK